MPKIKYAPYIEGTIPAFSNTSIDITYTPNMAVNENDIHALVLAVKRLEDRSIQKYYIAAGQDWNKVNHTVHFDIPVSDIGAVTDQGFKFTPGEYYKVQLAYAKNIEDAQISAAAGEKIPAAYLTYSSIGITKYVGNANLTIDSFDNNELFYSFECDDDTEKLYNVKCDISTNLEEYKSYNSFDSNSKSITFTSSLLNGQEYQATLTGTTINGLKIFAITTYFQENNIENLNINTFNPSLNFPEDYEYGAISLGENLSIIRKDTNNSDMSYVKVNNVKDTSVEHGKSYQYGLIDNEGNYKFLEEPIIPYFEDMFLQDKDRILRIKFNPKITSFKTTIQEAKQSTLGGKYPFFFRNGEEEYKEFPISGLVSYHSQDNEKFCTDAELGLIENSEQREQTNSDEIVTSNVRTTNLEDYNIAAERKFKIKVLDWLNNGKPKLFRSPTEGNYVVRLMNISLSPEERLGRMLHTFNATAVECAAADYATLVALDLVPGSEG